jgi:tetratricopeptide (TPR) repeat protein
MTAAGELDLFKVKLIAAMQQHVQGNLDAAAGMYDALLAEYPEHPELLHMVGSLHMQQQHWAEAAVYFTKALESAPKQAKTIAALARCYINLGNAHGEALERLIAKHPKLPELNDEGFFYNYARALKNGGRFVQCLSVCDKALASHPQSTVLLKLRGSVYMSLGRHQDARADMERVLAITPDDHHARTARGTARLLVSNLKEGFDDYAAQLDYEIKDKGLRFSMPQWHGESLAGKKILIWANQGIGDIVMFGGLLPWVLAQGATVTLAVYPKLVTLFARSFPTIEVVPFATNTGTTRACDYHTVIGQLMEYALPHYTPAAHPPVLKADAARAQALRKRYQATGKRLVGISWRTENRDTFSQRNIPLAQWGELLRLPHVQYVSLQYGDCAAEIGEANNAFSNRIIADPEIDAYNDSDALAAQIAAMDEVVTIQNATAHLAGALGVKTTLMLSAASDWRWGLNGTDSLWYKSVHIERQESLLEWQPVLARVGTRLTKPLV